MIDSSSIFRECISDNDNETLIYGADNLAQFTLAHGNIPSKCDRALPAARSHDIVVLPGKLDGQYQNWLRSTGLGTDHIVEYNPLSGRKTLSRMIAKNPEPIKRIIQKINKRPVYVPWFSGATEEMAAKAIHADLFGAPAPLSWKYNDKSKFKTICRQMDIPVVEDTVFLMNPEDKENSFEMEKAILTYLPDYPVVLIRGSLDNTGGSLVFKISKDDILGLHHRLLTFGIEKIIIEPFLDVTSSPNDQWIITREKKIRHLGKRDQICEHGTHHIATIKTPEPDSSQFHSIKKTSFKIVNEMAGSGYIGVVGIDYIVTDSGIYPVENNARFNGSSYVSIIVNNIEILTGCPVPCWKFIKVKTQACSFATLSKRMKSILFDGRMSNSVLPFNCENLASTGNFAVILLGSDPQKITDLELTLNNMGVI